MYVCCECNKNYCRSCVDQFSTLPLPSYQRERSLSRLHHLNQPAILVAPDVFGLSKHCQILADRLSDRTGYPVVVVDYFQGGGLPDKIITTFLSAPPGSKTLRGLERVWSLLSLSVCLVCLLPTIVWFLLGALPSKRKLAALEQVAAKLRDDGVERGPCQVEQARHIAEQARVAADKRTAAEAFARAAESEAVKVAEAKARQEFLVAQASEERATAALNAAEECGTKAESEAARAAIKQAFASHRQAVLKRETAEQLWAEQQAKLASLVFEEVEANAAVQRAEEALAYFAKTADEACAAGHPELPLKPLASLFESDNCQFCFPPRLSRSLAIVGFCFGGSLALEFGSKTEGPFSGHCAFKAVVSFHGELNENIVNRLSTPTLLQCADSDVAAAEAKVRACDALLRSRVDFQAEKFVVRRYVGSFHVFAVRGDVPNPASEEAKSLALGHCADFVLQHMPKPLPETKGVARVGKGTLSVDRIKAAIARSQTHASSQLVDAKDIIQFKADIKSRAEPRFSHFMEFIWGSDKRLTTLFELLTMPSIRSNSILTRGFCSHITEALGRSKRTEHIDLEPLFFRVVDVRGVNSLRRFNEWRPQNQLDFVDKSDYVVQLLKNPPTEDESGQSYVYVDDDPETELIDLLPTDLRNRVTVISLDKEADDGLTAASNSDRLAQLRNFLARAPSASVVVVWDFDCTLSARHLYKSYAR
jgi:dienelactone hydrolase